MIDFDFIFDLVEETYYSDNGWPLDLITLIKIPLIQCFYGICSMRQTIKDIEVNTTYRWFICLTLEDKLPHFTTYGKNYIQRFQEIGLIEAYFSYVLNQVVSARLIDPSDFFMDGTHIKACANNHKYTKQVVGNQAKFMIDQLEIEIDLDRRKHVKMSLKPAVKSVVKENINHRPRQCWFHKREHKEVFAYSAQVACDKHGWALAYSVEAGNVHDSQAFPAFFAKIEPFHPHYLIADSSYKTTSIAKFLLDQTITPVFPYMKPSGKKGYLPHKDFIYDEYFDCYFCPENQELTYRTTTREGYQEYKSDATICVNALNYLSVQKAKIIKNL